MIAAVLAAGESSRFSGNKLLAPLKGKPVIAHVLENLPRGLDQIVVVTGAFREDLQRAVASFDVECVHNDRYKEGLATSVSLAARWARDRGSDLLLTLGDLPFVTENEYRRLLRAYSGEAVFSSFENTWGPPAVFSNRELEKLVELRGHQGARELFPQAAKIEIPNAAKDIDFREDLKPPRGR